MHSLSQFLHRDPRLAPTGLVGLLLCATSGTVFFVQAKLVTQHKIILPNWVVGSYIVGTLVGTVLCLISLIKEKARIIPLLALVLLAILEKYFWPLTLMQGLLLLFTWWGSIIVVGVSVLAVFLLRSRLRRFRPFGQR